MRTNAITETLFKANSIKKTLELDQLVLKGVTERKKKCVQILDATFFTSAAYTNKIKTRQPWSTSLGTLTKPRLNAIEDYDNSATNTNFNILYHTKEKIYTHYNDVFRDIKPKNLLYIDHHTIDQISIQHNAQY
jgi:hypothetical protein